LTRIGLQEIVNPTDQRLKDMLYTAVNCLDKYKWDNFCMSARSSLFHDEYCNLDYKNTSYINDNMPTKSISVIFKARTGLLNINARAFKDNILGLCTLCNLDATENTYHFIGTCPILKNFRYQFFGVSILTIRKLHKILNTSSKNLANYITSALNYCDLILNEFY